MDQVPKVQEIAINDAFILEAHVFKVGQRRIRSTDPAFAVLLHDVFVQFWTRLPRESYNAIQNNASELGRFLVGRSACATRAREVDPQIGGTLPDGDRV